MRISLHLLLLDCCLATTVSIAANKSFQVSQDLHQSHITYKDAQPQEVDSWYVGAGIGITVPHVNKNTYGYAPTGSGFPNDQYIRGGTATEPLISLMGGYRWAMKQEWFPYYSLGALYTYVFDSNVNGKINQFSNPNFENYTYQYQIQRQTLMGVVKADIYRWLYIMPYLTVGGGFSRNNVQDYSEQALPGVTPRVSPGFSSQAKIYGSWMLGGGVDVIFSDQIIASVEYNYGDYGYTGTGNGSSNAQNLGANYSNSNLQTQLTSSTFAANIMYFFN